jgi:hypothetical protein
MKGMASVKRAQSTGLSKTVKLIGEGTEYRHMWECSYSDLHTRGAVNSLWNVIALCLLINYGLFFSCLCPTCLYAGINNGELLNEH